MAIKLLKIAVIYFVIAILAGLQMGITHDFSNVAFHAHCNLVGWVSLALIGLIYTAYPTMAQTALAHFHFWLHNIGLPVFLAGLLFIRAGNDGFGIPFAAGGSIVVILGVLCFAVNIFRQLK